MESKKSHENTEDNFIPINWKTRQNGQILTTNTGLRIGNLNNFLMIKKRKKNQ